MKTKQTWAADAARALIQFEQAARTACNFVEFTIGGSADSHTHTRLEAVVGEIWIHLYACVSWTCIFGSVGFALIVLRASSLARLAIARAAGRLVRGVVASPSFAASDFAAVTWGFVVVITIVRAVRVMVVIFAAVAAVCATCVIAIRVVVVILAVIAVGVTA
jgi:hypothetical protein